MARKFGKINVMKEHFYDYSYIINGVGGIGKTTMAYEMGKLATGSNEGTFVITCGVEPTPDHIPGLFGDRAQKFKQLSDIVKELVENKVEYPDTKFVCFDSIDEVYRIAEEYVVKEYNTTVDDDRKVKSIKQAFGGYQAGEDRTVSLILGLIAKLDTAGYKTIWIGHTKTKSKEGVDGIKYEQLTCNVANKYYTAIKDKVNLVAMCYFETIVANVKEKKNAFTKEMDKVGELKGMKRVMVFRDDDNNAIDTKSHFEYIVPKTDLGAVNLVKAVEDAIKAKVEATNAGLGHENITESVSMPKTIIPVEDVEAPKTKKATVSKKEEEAIDEDELENFEEIAADDQDKDPEEIIEEIKNSFKGLTVEAKTEIKNILSENNATKISAEIPMNVLIDILNIVREDQKVED